VTRLQPGGEAEFHLAASRGEGRGKCYMEPAYIAALAALAGSLIGGLTSFATTWLTQQTKARAQQLVDEMVRRQELYKDFIEEASRLYADALSTIKQTPPSSWPCTLWSAECAFTRRQKSLRTQTKLCD
jgi:hypothetical protein